MQHHQVEVEFVHTAAEQLDLVVRRVADHTQVEDLHRPLKLPSQDRFQEICIQFIGGERVAKRRDPQLPLDPREISFTVDQPGGVGETDAGDVLVPLGLDDPDAVLEHALGGVEDGIAVAKAMDEMFIEKAKEEPKGKLEQLRDKVTSVPRIPDKALKKEVSSKEKTKEKAEIRQKPKKIEVKEKKNEKAEKTSE